VTEVVSSSDAIDVPFNAVKAYVYELAFSDRTLLGACCQLRSLGLSARPVSAQSRPLECSRSILVSSIFACGNRLSARPGIPAAQSAGYVESTPSASRTCGHSCPILG
jgi:hypothetical protein